MPKKTKTPTLAPAFPAAPSRLPEHVIYFTVKGDTKAIVNFAADYSARKFLEDVIQKSKTTWKDEYTILIPSTNLEIRCETGLEQILEHEYNELEEVWELPTPYDRIAQMLRTGQYPKIEKVMPKEQEFDHDAGSRTGRAKPKGERKPRAAPVEGMITLAAICEELKIEPSKARQILRKSNMTKPQEGWVFDEKAAEKVKRLLKGK